MGKVLLAMHVGDRPEVEAFLSERIYEHNAAATGHRDAESFSAVQEVGGAVVAGISGYTWGGCCHVSYLWVAERSRGKGLGSALLSAAEGHARGKRCAIVFVSSHSFQAPAFYARRGYLEIARLDDHPPGHSSVFFAKRLTAKEA